MRRVVCVGGDVYFPGKGMQIERVCVCMCVWWARLKIFSLSYEKRVEETATDHFNPFQIYQWFWFSAEKLQSQSLYK